MRTISVRSTALAASAASLALLVTACGGSGDGGTADDSKGKADSSTAAAAPAAKALTSAELEKVALAQADVKTGKVTDKIPAKDDVAKDQVSADNETCLPLIHAQLGIAQAEPAASVKRSWTGQTETQSEGSGPDGQDMTNVDVNKMMLNLASYQDGGAEQALAALKKAAEQCAGGFTATAAGEQTPIAEVTTTTAPDGGDEAVAFTLGVPTGKDVNAPLKVVVVRKGATLASFSAVNLSAMFTGKDYDVPADVVDAQLDKLG
ncbi:hypothetical protein [Streptomyces sp. NPDC052012]|uniref:hypothetical protein n=1 Tax=Streptomyces sp. NPDC052012 TaxID=3155051 RepID=UPI0034501ADD